MELAISLFVLLSGISLFAQKPTVAIVVWDGKAKEGSDSADDGGFVSAEVLGDGSGFDESGFMGLSLPTEVKLVQCRLLISIISALSLHHPRT